MFTEIPPTQAQAFKKNAVESVKKLPEASKEYFQSMFPIASWLPRYNLQWFIGDFISGVTVTLVVIPQAISYSTKLANLPAEYGLYTSFIGCLIYALFATSKDVTIGATAVASLLIGQSIAEYLPNATTAEAITFAITISFWTGIIQLAIGLCRFGMIVDFFPIAVVAGFTLGIKGINTTRAPYLVIADFFANLDKVSKYDAILGLTALFFILFIKYSTAYGVKRVPALKYIGFLRNAIVLIVYTGVSYALSGNKNIKFALVKDIPYGLSGIQQPNTSISYAATVFPAVPAILVVCVLEHIAVVKTYGRINGYTTNANQEIIALGLTNLIVRIGCPNALGTFITGILVVFALFTLTNTLYWIPSAVLAAIVMAAIAELFVNFKILKNLWDIDILDFIGFWIAVIVTFFGSIELGIFSSVGWSLLVLLVRIARPNVSTLSRNSSGNWIDPEHEPFSKQQLQAPPTGILVFKIQESLTYPNSNFFVEQLKETVLNTFKYSSPPPANKSDRLWSDNTEQVALERAKKGLSVQPLLRAVVLDFGAVNHVDYTGLQALLDARDDMRRYAGHKVPFHFVHVRARHLNTLLRVPATESSASIDVTPSSNANAKSGLQAVFEKMRPGSKNEESGLSQQALQYFHFSVDDAVEAADLETREGGGSENEDVFIISTNGH
ncbi:hypothetical protein HDU98_000135 [Podochytrium sp. JEL0797]|nr:hypothetical protein HDU98_000135 [Podochytrium sp. JEL0797]